jgi:hypothetical protein
MPRKRKPSGRLRKGPFTATDFESALKLDGWSRESRGPHACWVHPTRPGKVQIDRKWTAVRTGHDPFRGVCSQGGYKRAELLRLLNGMPLD